VRLLAVVPARGASKRLPRKNVLPFGGRPLMCWSIAAAQALPSVVGCILTTDDAEIAAIGRAQGATIVDRPADLATDTASSIDVLVHAARQAWDSGLRFDGTLLLQPTNPLRPLPMLRAAVDRFAAEPCDSLVGVSVRRLKLGRIVDGCFVPDYMFGTQSRVMPPACYENGTIYLTKTATLLGRGSLTGDRVLAFETERPFDDVDIDEAVDLVLGEAVLAATRDRFEY
jgi:CMP-N-acetylneuraminic acid synthetase